MYLAVGCSQPDHGNRQSSFMLSASFAKLCENGTPCITPAWCDEWGCIRWSSAANRSVKQEGK